MTTEARRPTRTSTAPEERKPVERKPPAYQSKLLEILTPFGQVKGLVQSAVEDLNTAVNKSSAAAQAHSENASTLTRFRSRMENAENRLKTLFEETLPELTGRARGAMMAGRDALAEVTIVRARLDELDAELKAAAAEAVGTGVVEEAEMKSAPGKVAGMLSGVFGQISLIKEILLGEEAGVLDLIAQGEKTAKQDKAELEDEITKALEVQVTKTRELLSADVPTVADPEQSEAVSPENAMATLSERMRFLLSRTTKLAQDLENLTGSMTSEQVQEAIEANNRLADEIAGLRSEVQRVLGLEKTITDNANAIREIMKILDPDYVEPETAEPETGSMEGS